MDPQIGDVKLAYEIGKVGRNKHVWVRCPACNYERWVNYGVYLSPTRRLCKDCATNQAKKTFVIRQT